MNVSGEKQVYKLAEKAARIFLCAILVADWPMIVSGIGTFASNQKNLSIVHVVPVRSVLS